MTIPMSDTKLSFPFNGSSAILGEADFVRFFVSGGFMAVMI